MTKIETLASALAAFQAQHCGVVKDSRGSYGGYTSLAGVLQAIQPACAHGLSHTQTFAPDGDAMLVRTTLFHSSGQQVVSEIPVKIPGCDGRSMQQLGSAITYARRYSLQAIYGLATTDDDGETASPPAATKTAPKPAAKPTSVSKPAAQPKSSDEIPKREFDALMDRFVKMDTAVRDSILYEFKEYFGIPQTTKLADALTTGEQSVYLNLRLEELNS